MPLYLSQIGQYCFNFGQYTPSLNVLENGLFARYPNTSKLPKRGDRANRT